MKYESAAGEMLSAQKSTERSRWQGNPIGGQRRHPSSNAATPSCRFPSYLGMKYNSCIGWEGDMSVMWMPIPSEGKCLIGMAYGIGYEVDQFESSLAGQSARPAHDSAILVWGARDRGRSPAGRFSKKRYLTTCRLVLACWKWSGRTPPPGDNRSRAPQQ